MRGQTKPSISFGTVHKTINIDTRPGSLGDSKLWIVTPLDQLLFEQNAACKIAHAFGCRFGFLAS